VIVRPKEPFFAWARSLEDDSPIDEMKLSDLSSVFLIDSVDEVDEDKILRRHFQAMFEEQLVGWHRIVDAWPTKRTYAMFREWFEVSIVELVHDLSERAIKYDET